MASTVTVLNDKVAIVTGASSGLGRRFAVDLARAGAVVVGLARRAELLEQLAVEMRVFSAVSTTAVCDVTDLDGLEGILGKIETEHGRIDILVNNAGIDDRRGVPEHLDAYRRIMETNYFAAVAATLAVLPGMRDRREGVVINVSSDSGRAPGPRDAAYGASKAALGAFTESLALHLDGSGVRLHVLYPGWVPTATGVAVVDAGMPTPPRMVRRSEEQVSHLLLRNLEADRIDIDATRVARLAPLVRTFFPGLYRRGIRKAAGTS